MFRLQVSRYVARSPFNMLRHGLLLLAVAMAGVLALAIYNAFTAHRWRALYVPLQVAAPATVTPLFTVESGHLYEISVSVDISRAAPYGDCSLGDPPGRGGLYHDCKGHDSALELLWTVRNERRAVLASGKYPGEQISMGYVGNRVDVAIAEFSVPRRTIAFVELHYRRNPLALGSLHPYIAVYAPAPFWSASSAETVFMLLLVPVGGLGVVMVLFALAAQSRPVEL